MSKTITVFVTAKATVYSSFHNCLVENEYRIYFKVKRIPRTFKGKANAFIRAFEEQYNQSFEVNISSVEYIMCG
jgi:uncharacterized protein YggU (UPF0235/DUF167 family)